MPRRRRNTRRRWEGGRGGEGKAKDVKIWILKRGREDTVQSLE